MSADPSAESGTPSPRPSGSSGRAGSSGSSRRSSGSSGSSSRGDAWATLRRLKLGVGIAIALAVTGLLATAFLVVAASKTPAASGDELRAASPCARTKLLSQYVRNKMQESLQGTQLLRRSDIALAERGCMVDVSPVDVNILTEQANALGVPGLAPVAQPLSAAQQAQMQQQQPAPNVAPATAP